MIRVNPAGTVPAFVNTSAGSAEAALKVLEGDARVRVHDVHPAELADAVDVEIDAGASTVIVAGGDGTIAAAAAGVVDTDATLGIVPGGTLNHIPHRLGIPSDPAEALEVALEGIDRSVDVGRVNDHLFLNTCIFGVYVDFAFRRDRMKPAVGRWPASAAAAIRSLAGLRHRHLRLETDVVRRFHESPFVFIGVGERDLEAPMMGELKEDGRRGLHVVIPQPGSRLRPLVTVARMAVRGVEPWPCGGRPVSLVADRCRMSFDDATMQIALDGELISTDTPLDVSLDRNALKVRFAE